MKILKEYKNSIRFICRKCGNAQLAKKGSQCAISGLCSRCKGKEFKI